MGSSNEEEGAMSSRNAMGYWLRTRTAVQTGSVASSQPCFNATISWLRRALPFRTPLDPIARLRDPRSPQSLQLSSESMPASPSGSLDGSLTVGYVNSLVSGNSRVSRRDVDLPLDLSLELEASSTLLDEEDDVSISRSPGFRDFPDISPAPESADRGSPEEGEGDDDEAGAVDAEAHFRCCEQVAAADVLTPGFLRQAMECVICMDEFREGDDEDKPLVQMPGCDHVFHAQCLRKWIERNHSTCPLCRTTIAADSMGRRRTI